MYMKYQEGPSKIWQIQNIYIKSRKKCKLHT
jgi:hypothetical protein